MYEFRHCEPVTDVTGVAIRIPLDLAAGCRNLLFACPICHMDVLPGASFDFLFQSIKLRRGEELTQCDIQTVAQLLDRNDRQIPAIAVHHTVNS